MCEKKFRVTKNLSINIYYVSPIKIMKYISSIPYRGKFRRRKFSPPSESFVAFPRQKIKIRSLNTRFFYKQRFFSTQPHYCLTFSWIELQMLLKCCLIHLTIIILRNILYLAYLCQCLGLNLFMSYLYDLFFIFILISIVIKHIKSFKQTYLFFLHFKLLEW